MEKSVWLDGQRVQGWEGPAETKTLLQENAGSEFK